MLYMPCSYYYRLSCKINVVFIFNSFYLLHLFRQVYRFVKPFEHTAVVITLKTGYWIHSYFSLCPVFCCAFVKMQHCFFAGIWWFAYNIELQRFFNFLRRILQSAYATKYWSVEEKKYENNTRNKNASITNSGLRASNQSHCITCIDFEFTKTILLLLPLSLFKRIPFGLGLGLGLISYVSVLR